ncbi:MAG: hypothetical protein LBB56_01870 [Chitinispirillales bacterium]|nr:hypothetical protein [Chitinispirillales bacterium]
MKLNIPSRYNRDIENAVRLLWGEECSAVYLFGSLVTGKTHEDFDDDDRFYSMLNNLGEVVQIG